MNDEQLWPLFLAWETASRDSIDVKRLYIDMAGDLVSGVLLSQILYWHLPTATGSALRMIAQGCGVKHEEKWWLVKKREDWWEECRITPKQFDRSSDVLIKKDYISIKRFHFHGLPTIHLHLHVIPFLTSMKMILFPGNSNLTFGEVGTLPLGKFQFDQRSNYNNDNTREEISGETGRERKDPTPTSPASHSPASGGNFSLSVGQGKTPTPAPHDPLSPDELGGEGLATQGEGEERKTRPDVPALPVPASAPPQTSSVPVLEQCVVNLDGVRGLMAVCAPAPPAPPTALAPPSFTPEPQWPASCTRCGARQEDHDSGGQCVPTGATDHGPAPPGRGPGPA